MEIKKMSLAAIQGKLSRAEMRNIMAGTSTVDDVEGGDNKCNLFCSSDASCDSVCPSCEEMPNWDKKMCVKR
jgi:hypothetical protein